MSGGHRPPSFRGTVGGAHSLLGIPKCGCHEVPLAEPVRGSQGHRAWVPQAEPRGTRRSSLIVPGLRCAQPPATRIGSALLPGTETLESHHPLAIMCERSSMSRPPRTQFHAALCFCELF